MYYIYILYSPTSFIYYVGQTDNPEERLFSHNNSTRNTYTSKHRPWVLKCVIPFSSRSVAMIWEKYLKKLKSKKYIESLIEERSKREREVQLVRVPTCRD